MSKIHSSTKIIRDENESGGEVEEDLSESDRQSISSNDLELSQVKEESFYKQWLFFPDIISLKQYNNNVEIIESRL